VGEFDVAPESNVTYRLAGFTNETAPTGNGSAHTTQRRKLGGFESLPLSVDASRQDVEFLQDLADAGEAIPMFMTLASNITYGGSLTIQGEIDPNTGDGQVEIGALGPVFEQL
jgi:hypothetical protein